MSDFWGLSDGEDATDTGTEYEAPGGNFAPIPDGSNVLALIDTAKWETVKDGIAEFVSLTWTVMEPDEFKNRKIFHKLFIDDCDPKVTDPDKAVKKRDRALRMFAAIDANAGGKLAKKRAKPSDEDMQKALLNRPMIIRLAVWEVSDDRGTASGNWVQAVSSKATSKVNITDAKPPKASAPRGSSVRDDIGEDIPF